MSSRAPTALAVVLLAAMLVGPAPAEPADRMRALSGGTFQMGTSPETFEELAGLTDAPSSRVFEPEQPRHEMTIGPFRIDVNDVTNREFARFIGAQPEWRRDRVPADEHNGRYLEHWPSPDRPPDDAGDHPVIFVTWYAAAAYCEWRGARLPTEAEWEFAAGAGLDDRLYPWGDEPPTDDRVNWYANGIDRTVAVASYEPNPFGLFDMSGNVWKFLADPWRDRYDSPPVSRLTPSQALAARDRGRRVVRGGSWGASAANLRVRYRDSHRPWDAREMVGFRCAADAG